jgi:hypothetical protein
MVEYLLSLDESGWLDFKRKMYGVADSKAKHYEWQRNEMVRDILSLANGNTHSAGKPAYLVIGATDERNTANSRDLLDIGDFTPPKKHVMSWVNAHADPAVEEINTYLIPYQGKRLFVIEILPGRHVHKLKRPLQTDHSKTYHENTVFMRAGDSIITADAKQVQTLERAKKQAHAVNRYVNPIWLLGIFSALLFGTMTVPLNDSPTTQALIQEFGEVNLRLFINVFLAIIMGVVGAAFGWTIMQLQDARIFWIRATWKGKLGLSIWFIIMISFTVWSLKNFGS